jgi:hypothetical protein
MTIFDYIKNILFFKKTFVQNNIEHLKEYNPYMVNRWISMNDPESANIINETTNQINYLQNDKEMHYKILLNVVPIKKYKQINYIKKTEKGN